MLTNVSSRHESEAAAKPDILATFRLGSAYLLHQDVAVQFVGPSQYDNSSARPEGRLYTPCHQQMETCTPSCD